LTIDINKSNIALILAAVLCIAR